MAHGGAEVEKISRVLPADKRITTVDMRHSGFARPGSPGFGREVGPMPGRRRELDTAKRAVERFDEEMRVRHESAKAAMVSRMADQFFVREGRDENAQPARSSRELQGGLTAAGARQLESQIRNGEGPEVTPPEMRQTRIDMPVQIGETTQAKSTETGDQLVSGQNLDVRA